MSYKIKTVTLLRYDIASMKEHSSFDLITQHLRLAETRNNEAVDIFPHTN